MLMTKRRRPAFRTIEGWARSVLLEAGAIREYEEHGWAQDRADPHARERALSSLAKMRRPASLRSKRRLRSKTFWVRSATPLPWSTRPRSRTRVKPINSPAGLSCGDGA